MKNGKSKAAEKHKPGREDATQPTGRRLPTLPESARKRGRKRASESCAPEIRARLAAWKQTPEASRSSLRTLAAEMGTSHQLLSFYLRRWDKWQAKEYQRNANDICARAKAEKRPMTGDEQAQVVAYTRAALQSMINFSVVPAMLTALRKEALRGKLSRQHLRLAKLIADRGYGREIQEILAACRLGVCETESLERGKC